MFFISGIIGIIGSILGAYASYKFQLKKEEKREKQEYESLYLILINDIRGIFEYHNALDRTPLKELKVDISLWSNVKYEFAKTNKSVEEWKSFNDFYKECEKWNIFIENSTYDDSVPPKYNKLIKKAKKVDSSFDDLKYMKENN